MRTELKFKTLQEKNIYLHSYNKLFSSHQLRFRCISTNANQVYPEVGRAL